MNSLLGVQRWENVASIFRVKEKAKQEIIMK
jgi:hypothetical protein